MSVYVDDLQIWPNARGIFRTGSCHMAADTLEELHEMALKIGMKRAWFQPGKGRHPHYDLVKSRRDQAVALGAKEVTGRDLIMMWRAQRELRQVQRLDYSKPPPGHRCWVIGGCGTNADQFLFHNIEGWRDKGGAISAPAKADGWPTEQECRAAAWAHYKAHNDPPGCSERFNCAGYGEQVRGWKFRFGITSDEVLYATVLLARAAAWAWHDRRLVAHEKVGNDPRHRIDFCGSCGAENEPQEDDECPECDATSCLISTWGEQQAERYRTSERYTAHDPSIDEASLTWPRCLTWSDEQVAEFERWLVDSTAEMPEVLRG